MNTSMQPPKLEELNVLDNFIFNELTMQADPLKATQFCRIVLETILQKPVRELKIFPQKVVQGVGGRHGIQIDAYVEAYQLADNTEVADVQIQPDIFDLEPNKYPEMQLEKRTRYYHSIIDTKIFKRGDSYDKMQNVFVIMILPYDPFGMDRMLYTVKRHCVEEPDMPYEDGSITLILYTRGKKNIPSQALQSMLQYMENSNEANATNEDLRTIHRMLTEIRQNSEIGVKYMHAWDIEMHFRQEGYDLGKEQGLKLGREQGLELGREQGLEQGLELGKEQGLDLGKWNTLVSIVCKKLRKGLSASEIAEQLEESPEVIKQLCELAKQSAPDYDVEEIVESYLQNTKSSTTP